MADFPPQCVGKILSWISKDYLTLHATSNVNKLWCQQALCFLYRHPWKYLPEELTLVNTSKEACPLVNLRIAKLCQTLINCVPIDSFNCLDQWEALRKTTSFKPLVDYCSYLREIDLTWLTSCSWNVNSDSLNESLEFFISIEVAEILAKYLWIEYGYKIRTLILARSIPLEQFLPPASPSPLTTLDIELVSFKSAHADLINSTWHSLQTFKITATVVDDAAVARVISHQTSMKKLVIRSMESYSIHHTIDALVKYHARSLTHLKLSMCILTLVETQDKLLFNAALSKLRHFSNLTSLKLMGWKLADNDIMYGVAPYLRKLSKFAFEEVPFNSRTCEAIMRAAGKNLLQATILTENQELGNSLVILAIHCPNLIYLDIQKMCYQSKHLLQCLKLWPHLKTLKLGSVENREPHIGDQIVNGIVTSLPQLEYLSMGPSKISELSLSYLASHSNLQCIRLNSFAYTFTRQQAHSLLGNRIAIDLI
ncbi:hypothetical protein K7432_014425 [Basidiobolus ranarum]|uniref:F-box domain-containing protein n=1 Tax=Basidiobolus ranarum TaxID=34480 RepID=A0ABR2VPJ4_9FUNG